jgi:hypothetical protein
LAAILMKLRNVPDDELADIEALLQQHEFEYYTTSAGMLGISMPALWLVDASNLAQARSLLDDYARQRQAAARADYEAQRQSGGQRTMADIARERPLRFVLSLVAVMVLLYVSFVPFL